LPKQQEKRKTKKNEKTETTFADIPIPAPTPPVALAPTPPTFTPAVPDFFFKKGHNLPKQNERTLHSGTRKSIDLSTNVQSTLDFITVSMLQHNNKTRKVSTDFKSISAPTDPLAPAPAWADPLASAPTYLPF
jgi:hypothetical protein